MVERIAFYQYLIEEEITDRWLDIHDFHYDKYMSDKDVPAYSHRFSVYKYEGLTLIDGVVTIWPTDNNMIRINCYEHNTRNLFARFYYWEYGTDDKYMNIINGRVLAKMKELNIKVVKPEERDNNENY